MVGQVLDNSGKYTVQAAARAVGVTAGRLRTWERRYAVPRPARSETGRRLYSDADIAQLRRLNALVASGVAPAQAARLVLSEPAAPEAAPRQPGGASPAAIALAAAAGRLDAAAVQGAIREAVASLGWEGALRQVLFPALVEVGHRWEAGALAPAQEHLLSEAVRLELQAATAAVRRPAAAAPLALLACPGGERHDLGLLALRLLLLGRGLRVLFLGADLPIDALIGAARDARPAVVCLSGTAPATTPELGAAARALLASGAPLRTYVGGPALRDSPGVALPAGHLPDDLGEAADVIARAVGALNP